MGMVITAHDTCDRCQGKYNPREVDVESLAQEQNAKMEPLFRFETAGNSELVYTDVCPSCEKTLTKLFESAGPIKRSAGQRGPRKKKGGSKPPSSPSTPPEE